MKLLWDYEEDFLLLQDKIDKDVAMKLVLRKEKGVFWEIDDCGEIEIDHSDIDQVVFVKPRLFKKGAILFQWKNMESGKDQSLDFSVTQKHKATFYKIFHILKKNGFVVIAL